MEDEEEQDQNEDPRSEKNYNENNEKSSKNNFEKTNNVIIRTETSQLMWIESANYKNIMKLRDYQKSI